LSSLLASISYRQEIDDWLGNGLANTKARIAIAALLA